MGYFRLRPEGPIAKVIEVLGEGQLAPLHQRGELGSIFQYSEVSCRQHILLGF